MQGSAVRPRSGMTVQPRGRNGGALREDARASGTSVPRRSPVPRHCAGGTKKKGPLERLAQGARESSGDLLSRTRGPGTIGDLRLNFRVRDGNGCDPHSITAETISCMEKNSLSQSPECRSKAGPGCPRGTVEPNR